jgi:hypothetical protein
MASAESASPECGCPAENRTAGHQLQKRCDIFMESILTVFKILLIWQGDVQVLYR